MPSISAAPRLRAVLASTLILVAPHPVTADDAAASVYEVVAGPRYSTSAALNSYHRLDCSTANAYFGNSACTLNVDTVSAGCRWEKQSTDSVTTVPGSSPCRVTINGPVPFRRVAAYCHLGTTDDAVKVTYWIGRSPGSTLSPIEFYAKPTAVPTKFNGNATATVQYALKITAVEAFATATAAGGPVALGTISETFLVDFAYPVKDTCPNRDNAMYSIGNVRDSRPDTVPADNAPTGFIKATVVTV